MYYTSKETKTFWLRFSSNSHDCGFLVFRWSTEHRVPESGTDGCGSSWCASRSEVNKSGGNLSGHCRRKVCCDVTKRSFLEVDWCDNTLVELTAASPLTDNCCKWRSKLKGQPWFRLSMKCVKKSFSSFYNNLGFCLQTGPA